jgi:hypothetical protein
MDASSIPTVPEIQQQVRSLSDSINREDSASVKSLDSFLQQIRVCADGVSKRLEAAKQEEKAKREEKATQKEKLAKSIWDQITALTAKWNELQGVVPPAPEASAPVPDAVKPTVSMPPPAPRPIVADKPVAKRPKKESAGRGGAGKPPAIRGGKSAVRGGKAFAPPLGRGKGAAIPAAGEVPPHEDETQVLDYYGNDGEEPYEGETQPR